MSAFNIRRATPADSNFITNSWMQSYRKSDFAKYIPTYAYNTGHHALVKLAIDRSITFCAVAKDDENQIFGWLCIEPPQTMHYIYVKHSFRDLGIAASLIEHSKIFEQELLFSHLTKCKLSLKLFEIGKYDPYKFFKGENNG